MTDTTDTASLKKQIETAADIIRDLIDKLEAERQRLELVREQRDNELRTNSQLEEEITELKAKLANPVVLQDFHAASIQSTQPFNLFDIIVATQVSDAKAIRSAGFTVKGE